MMMESTPSISSHISYNTLFSNLERHLAKELHEKKHSRFYKRKQALYYEGNPLTGIYFIQSGRAKSYKIGPEGKQYILRIANAQDILGLESIFKADPYFYSTAEMLEEGWVHLIEKRVFMDLINKDPRIATSMMTALASQVMTSDEERLDLAQRAVRERMAKLLITLSNHYGTPTKMGVSLHLKLSREEIAEMIGTAAESAIRLLSEFKEEKMIALEGKDIIILDEKRLMSTANLND